MQKKTLIALSILILGVGGSAWFIFGSNTKTGIPGISFLPSGDSDPRFSANIADAKENLTDKVVKDYGGEILLLNPQGQGRDKPLSLPSDDRLNEILTKAAQTPIPVTEFSEKDITIGASTSKDAVRAYLNALNAVEEKNTTLYTRYYPIVSSYVVNGNSQELDALVSEISTHVNALLAIPVPATWKDFHLAFINLWQHKLVYTKALLAKEDDPIRSAGGAQNLQTLLAQEDNLRTTYLSLLKSANF